MSEEKNTLRKKSSKGRKFLAVFGILLVSVGIFFSAFGMSFKILMMPEKNMDKKDEQTEIERLKIENTQLQKDVRRLEEENKILKGEEEEDSDSDSSGKSRSESSSSSKSKSSSDTSNSKSSKSSSSDDED